MNALFPAREGYVDLLSRGESSGFGCCTEDWMEWGRVWLERWVVGGEPESEPLSLPDPRPMSRWNGDLWDTIGE